MLDSNPCTLPSQPVGVGQVLAFVRLEGCICKMCLTAIPPRRVAGRVTWGRHAPRPGVPRRPAAMAGVGLTSVPSLERPAERGTPCPRSHTPSVLRDGSRLSSRGDRPDPSRPQVPQSWDTAPGSPRASSASGVTLGLGLALARQVVAIVLQEARARLAAQRSPNWGPA